MVTRVTPDVLDMPDQRNLLFNGGFEIWSRGPSIAIPTNSTLGVYGPDLWAMSTNPNQAFTIARVAALTGNGQYACKVQRNSGQTGVAQLIFEQPFDLLRILPTRGAILTASYTLKAGGNWSPTSGTLNCTLCYGTGTNSKLAIAGFAGQTAVGTGTHNITATPTRYSFVNTAIAAGATQLSLVFYWSPTGTAGADDSFTVDDIQLEIAASASAFAPVSVELEAARCARWLPAITF